MYEIFFTASSNRAYRKLPANIQRKVDSAIQELQANPYHPSLHTHKRRGEGELWQARVTRDFRIFFLLEGRTITIIDIRAHDK